jgi:Flp pilus assembly protein TadG
MRKILKLCAGSDAAEIAEFAIVLPILFFLVLAMFWLGQAYNISNNLNKAATDGLAAALKNSCATCGNTAASQVQIADAIEKAFQAGSLKPGNLQAYTPKPDTPTCPSTPITSVTSSTGVAYALEVCTGMPLWPTTTTILGTRIAMQYSTPIAFPVAAFKSVTLQAVVQGRPEN